MDAIKPSDLIGLFDAWKTLFTDQREFLIALDATVGDSDLGITMSKSFAAAADAVTAQADVADIAKLLRIAGATMARAAPSTMGTLMATGFLRASKALDGVSEMGTQEVAAFWAAFRDGIAERGKARVGDKTILDVLDPIALALESAASLGQPLPDALAAAVSAAEAALENTKSMVAQHGKAAVFREKTIGLQDAGATVGVLLVRTLHTFVQP